MMKLIKMTGVITTVFLGISCGKAANQNQGLTVTVGNPNPVLIPVGSGVTVNGVALTPPLFVLNQLTLTYSGTGGITIFDIEISTTSASGTAYSCILVGDPLHLAFPTQSGISPAGQVIILGPSPSASPVPVASTSIGCSGVPVPNPLPNSFNIPMQVTVKAGLLPDAIHAPNNVTGRVIGTTAITIQ